MRSTGSTMLRRTVAVVAVAGTCLAGVTLAVQLADDGRAPDARPTGEPPVSTVAPPAPTVGGTGGMGVEPPPAPKPTIDDLLAELRPANAAFNPPASMELGEAEEIELLVSRRRTVAELQEELQGSGELEGEEIRVSDAMEAQLAGVGFAIEPITPAVQLVAGEGVTRWKWAVEPTKAGEQRLHLTLSAVFALDGLERPYTIRTFARTLEVEVTLQERLSGYVEEHWEWLWATLLVPVGGWLVRRRRHGASAAPATPAAHATASARGPRRRRAERARTGRRRRGRDR